MPIVDVEVPAQAGWARIVDLLAALALAALAGWWFSAPADLGPGERSIVLALGLGATLLGWSARRSTPCRLRWDGRQWSLAMRAQPEPVTFGHLRVVVDWQFAMLLRFDPGAGGALRGCRWLALGRRSLDGDWHLLRCAVRCQGHPEAGAESAPRLEVLG